MRITPLADCYDPPPRQEEVMKIEEIPTFAGLGIHSERHIAALRSAPKHFPKDRIQRATLPSGLTIEYAIESSDEPETEDLPEERLVMINGFMMTKEGWAPVIDILVDKWDAKTQGKKLKILSFDNRGAGGSDAPFTRYTTSQMAQDTLSLLNYVGWDSAHFVGGSMGGMIAIELAATVPERVLSLALLLTTRGAYLPHPRMWKPFLGSVLGGSMQCVMELLYPSTILNKPIDGRDGLTVQDVLKKYHATPQSDNALPPLYALIAQGVACLTHWVSDERLELVAKSDFPILIIGGKQDILIPPENSVTLIERLKGEHVHTLFFETGGHGAFFQFVEEIADGLQQTIQRAKLDGVISRTNEKKAMWRVDGPKARVHQCLRSHFEIFAKKVATLFPMPFEPEVVSSPGIHTQRQVEALYAASKYFGEGVAKEAFISTGITASYAVLELPPMNASVGVEQVVLVAGFMQPKDTWAHFIDSLLSKWNQKQRGVGLSILVLDNRGFGGTDAPFGMYSTRTMAEDILALMDHIGWRSAHIVGGSSVPAKANSMVDTLFPQEYVATTRIAETGESVRSAIARMYELQLKKWPEPSLSGVMGQTAAVQTHFVSDERLHDMNDAGFPILIVSAMLDDVIPAAESIVLKEHLSGEHVHTLFFDTGGHGAICQYADEIADEVIETMRRAYQTPSKILEQHIACPGKTLKVLTLITAEWVTRTLLWNYSTSGMAQDTLAPLDVLGGRTAHVGGASDSVGVDHGLRLPQGGVGSTHRWTAHSMGTEEPGKTLKVLTLDNRGVGDTDAPWGKYSTSDMAQDTLALLDAVGWKTAHLAGVSMGGMISQEIALAAPERLQSLSLLVTSPGSFTPDASAYPAILTTLVSSDMDNVTNAMLSFLYPDSFLVSKNGDNGTMHDVFFKYHMEVAATLGAPSSSGALGQTAALVLHNVSDKKLTKIRDYGFPILIIGAKQDQCINVSHSLHFSKVLESDHTKLVMYEDAGHACFLQHIDEIADNIWIQYRSISVSYVIRGVLPTWLNGRNDKMGTVQGLWQCASQYREHHAAFVLSSFCIVYIALQTFAIPGPIVLSILSGAMYPFMQAQILVAFCATTGASLCFMLSYFLGRGVFNKVLAGMIGRFKEKIAHNQGNLFYYLLFLRITPLLPNWFVNIACPLVGVPFKYFFLATLIGLVPANFLHISTGATLNGAAGASGGSNAVSFAVLFLLQFVALLPTLFKGKIEKYEKEAYEKSKKTKISIVAAMEPTVWEQWPHAFMETPDGIRLHYVDVGPRDALPVMMVHGWPDLWFGWRVRTFPTSAIETVLNENCFDMNPAPDPSAWLHVSTHCTGKTYLPLEVVVEKVPQFKYQQFLANTDVSGKVLDASPRRLLTAIFRKPSEMGPRATRMSLPKMLMAVDSDVDLPVFTQRSTLLSEAELDYYVEQYSISKFASTCQTYATGKIDFENELDLPRVIKHPALFIGAAKDAVLKPEMARGMVKVIPSLETKIAEDAGHWVLWEKKEEVNAILSEWLAKIAASGSNLSAKFWQFSKSAASWRDMTQPRKHMDSSVWKQWPHSFVTTPEGIKIHYVDVGPRDGPPVVMLHGWPDLWFGWRIRTDALKIERAVVLGHDWGGNASWRMALYHPDRVLAVCGVCTPFVPPRKQYMSLEDLCKYLPQFKYQQFLADAKNSGKALDASPRRLATAIFRRKTEYGPKEEALPLHELLKVVNTDVDHVIFKERTEMLSEDELQYYIDQYTQSKFTSANWVRPRAQAGDGQGNAEGDSEPPDGAGRGRRTLGAVRAA
ncbi:SNARE associated Golgi protein [Phytophthora cactorum]|nr:SNARE associated Golgi protein [Phytophthora cactorum]